jgi:hypothetical protein
VSTSQATTLIPVLRTMGTTARSTCAGIAETSSQPAGPPVGHRWGDPYRVHRQLRQAGQLAGPAGEVVYRGTHAHVGEHPQVVLGVRTDRRTGGRAHRRQ